MLHEEDNTTAFPLQRASTKSLAECLVEVKALGKEQDEKDVDWVRARDLRKEGEKPFVLYEGRIEAQDLVQGGLGDCWLVSALAVLAENPAAIRACCREKEASLSGGYNYRFYDGRIKKWVDIHIDDFIPVHKGTKNCVYMTPHNNEMWAILLEKAFAKFCGSFAALHSGFHMEAWHAITGNHVFMLKKEGVFWTRYNMGFRSPSSGPRDVTLEATGEKVGGWTDLPRVLLAYQARKCLIGASILRKAGHGVEHEQATGLVEGHAYSILDVRVVGGGVLGAIQKMGVKVGQDKTTSLIKLRNPWGNTHWKGDWGPESKKWELYPEVARELGHSNKKDE